MQDIVNSSKGFCMKFTFLPLARAMALGTALIAASTASIAQAAPASEGIVVYNAQHVSLAKAWAQAFTHDTGIKVTLRDGSDTELGNQIVQEGARSPADVFLTENSPAMALVDQAGLFAPLDAATLAQVPADFRPTDGHWIGIAARSTVFAYNKTRLKADQLPASLLDLAKPAWKGRWGASPTGADFQAIVSALLELKGEAATVAWLKGMKENATFFRGNSAVLKAINAGQIDGGVIYHYYWFRDQDKTSENSSHTALHYFRHQDPGAFVSISGAGVLASSSHQAQAQEFVKWLSGKGGQTILKTGDSFEYAVGQGAQSNPKLVPLAELQAPSVNPSSLNSKKVSDMMTQANLM
jgi:iron(III) transport system substrate-binding protein